MQHAYINTCCIKVVSYVYASKYYHKRLSFKVFSYVYASKSFHTFMHQSLFIPLQGTLFLDFGKAFDLVDQSVLLSKLSTCKFSDATHKLLCSYDRKLWIAVKVCHNQQVSNQESPKDPSWDPQYF